MATATSTPAGAATLLGQRSETVMAMALFGMLAILVVPLPGYLIDLLLALNLALTVVL